MNIRLLIVLIFSTFLIQAQSFVTVTSSGSNLLQIGESRIITGDIDNDDDLDILYSGVDLQGFPVVKLFRNDGNFNFIPLGLSIIQVAKGDVSFTDFDNDNYLDFLISGTDVNNKYITRLYRNNKNNTFSPVNTSIDSVTSSCSKWFDYDKDGDLDLILAGVKNNNQKICKLYINTKGSFTERLTSIKPFNHGSIAIADFNRDNYADIAIMGNGVSNYLTEVYYGDKKGNFTEQGFGLQALGYGTIEAGDYNQDGFPDLIVSGLNINGQTYLYKNTTGLGFVQASSNFTGTYKGDLSWGDYDNDGDLDILNTGYVTTNSGAYLYRNDGGDNFTPVTQPFKNVYNSSSKFFDVDNDGDLDVLISGSTFSSPATYLYNNTTSISNISPSVPAGLKHLVSEDSVLLSWNKGSDNETQVNGLTYKVWLSTDKDSFNLISPISNIGTGYNKLTQFGFYNTTSTGWFKNLNQSIYYWKVQAIDNGYRGSAFSIIDSFIICKKIRIGHDTALCLKDTLKLKVGSNSEVVNWYSKRKGLVKSNSFSYQHVVSETDTIWARLTNFLGCTLYDTLIVVAKPLPDVSLSDSLKICYNTNYQLQQGLAGDSVKWFSKNILLLSDLNTLSGKALKRDTITVLVKTSNGCSNKDRTIIDTLPLPKFPVLRDTSICKGRTLSKDYISSDTLYWYLPNSISGIKSNSIYVPQSDTAYTIKVKAVNSIGCTKYDTANVAVRALPTVNAGKDTTICFNELFKLGGLPSASGKGIKSYQWNPSNMIDTSNIPNPFIKVASNQTFQLVVTDSSGCVGVDSVKINVNPKTELNTGGTKFVCIGDSIILGNSPVATGSLYPYNYQWMPGNLNTANPKVTPKQTTKFTLTVFTYHCKSDTASIVVTVLPLPKTTISADTTIGYNQSVVLKATGGNTFLWTPSNSLIDYTTATPTASPAENTLYIVKVTDDKGCSAYDSVKVYIRNEVFIPTLFTPNNDKNNDELKLYGAGVQYVKLTIYDRYGETVFESDDLEKLKESGWDGMQNGKEAPQGIYMWSLKGNYANGSEINYNGNKGTIMLMR